MGKKANKVTYKLKVPIEEVDGEDLSQPITQLVFPRLKFKHLERLEEVERESGERSFGAIRRFIESVCGLDEGVGLELDLEDIEGVQEKLVASMPKKLRDRLEKSEKDGDQGKPETASSPKSAGASGT